MSLFGKSNDESRNRKEIKSQVDKLMKEYDKEEIDGPTYIEKMMSLASSHRKKDKK